MNVQLGVGKNNLFSRGVVTVMNEKHLSQLWQWPSVLSLLFLISSVISIQGGAEFLGKLFGELTVSAPDNKPAIGYFGAIIGGALFFMSTCALSLHAKRHGSCWHERIPIVFLDGLKTSSWEGKVFQLTMLFALAILPACGIVKCIEVAEQGDICQENTTYVHEGSKTTLLWPPVADKKAKGRQMRLRSGNANGSACLVGVEISPRIGTPLLVYGLPSLGGCLGLYAFALIFRKRSASQNPVI